MLLDIGLLADQILSTPPPTRLLLPLPSPPYFLFIYHRVWAVDRHNLQKEVDTSIDMLKMKNVELQSVLDYLKAQPEKVDVDEAVSATYPLYNQ